MLAGRAVNQRVLSLVCERYGVARLLVFGPVARGTAAPDSDVDVLYELLPERRLG